MENNCHNLKVCICTIAMLTAYVDLDLARDLFCYVIIT